MWELLRAGGPVMAPIGLCSVVGLAFIIERWLALRRRRVVLPEVIEAVETLSAGHDFTVARAILDRNPGPFANIVRAGLDHAGADWTIIRDALQEAGRRESVLLMRNLGVLETIAAVAPLLGLLGTMFGMIRLFKRFSSVTQGQADYFSSGIAEAMIATAAGLCIGIPVLVAHNWLRGRGERIVHDLELYSAKVLDTLRARPRQPASTPPEVGAGVR